MDTANYFYDQTYGKPSGEKNFMKVWESAKGYGYQKALAYGFVSHDTVCGADSTPCRMAQATSPQEEFPPYLPTGYVIYKEKTPVS